MLLSWTYKARGTSIVSGMSGLGCSGDDGRISSLTFPVYGGAKHISGCALADPYTNCLYSFMYCYIRRFVLLLFLRINVRVFAKVRKWLGVVGRFAVSGASFPSLTCRSLRICGSYDMVWGGVNILWKILEFRKRKSNGGKRESGEWRRYCRRMGLDKGDWMNNL